MGARVKRDWKGVVKGERWQRISDGVVVLVIKLLPNAYMESSMKLGFFAEANPVTVEWEDLDNFLKLYKKD